MITSKDDPIQIKTLWMLFNPDEPENNNEEEIDLILAFEANKFLRLEDFSSEDVFIDLSKKEMYIHGKNGEKVVFSELGDEYVKTLTTYKFSKHARVMLLQIDPETNDRMMVDENCGLEASIVLIENKTENNEPKNRNPVAPDGPDNEAVKQAFKQVKKRISEGKSLETLLKKENELAESKSYKESEETYTKVESDSSDRKHPRASYDRGVEFNKRKDYKEAIEAFAKAESDSPDGKYPSASNNRGIALDELKRYEDAIAAYTKAESDSPDGKYPAASYNRGLILDKLNRYEEAVEAYAKAESDSPDGKYPAASYNRGEALSQLKRYEEAVAAYAKAESDSPDGKYEFASQNRGDALFELNRYEEAIAAYTKSENDSWRGKYPFVSNKRGIALGMLNRYEEAIAAFTKAESDCLFGKFPEASRNRGDALTKLGRHKEAKLAFAKAKRDASFQKFTGYAAGIGIGVVFLFVFLLFLDRCEHDWKSMNTYEVVLEVKDFEKGSFSIGPTFEKLVYDHKITDYNLKEISFDSTKIGAIYTGRELQIGQEYTMILQDMGDTGFAIMGHKRNFVESGTWEFTLFEKIVIGFFLIIIIIGILRFILNKF